jgi:hypothetical protein
MAATVTDKRRAASANLSRNAVLEAELVAKVDGALSNLSCARLERVFGPRTNEELAANTTALLLKDSA